MELRHLRYFVAVAEELHFGRAAARLNLSQPPLSRQIRDLEAELGVTLFVRDRRGVTLTREGAALLGEARRALAQAEHVARVADRVRRGVAGSLRIGYVHSALYGAVPPMLRAFRARAPDVEVSVRELVTSELVEELHLDRLDLAFVRPPVEDDALALRVLGEEPLVAAVPSGHPLADRARIRIADLAGEPFVLFPQPTGPGFWDVIAGACRAAGFTPRVAQEGDQIHVIVGLVGAGFGVTLVPEPVRNLRLPGVRYLRLDDPVPALPLAVLWHRDRRFPALDSFLAGAGAGVGA